MTYRILSTVALVGLIGTACQSENNPAQVPASGAPEPRVSQQDESLQGNDQQLEQGSDEQLDVTPAVTIVAIDVDCPEAAVFFPTDSSTLDEQDKQLLDRVAACLKGTGDKEQINITGATDPTGTAKYNKQLAERRAQSVADYLKQQGVKDNGFEIYARGEQGVTEGLPRLYPLQRHAVVGTSDQP